VTLCGANALFADLGLDVEARCALAKRLRDAHRARLSARAVNALNLAERFRSERRVLEALVGAPGAADGVLTPPLRKALGSLQARSERLASTMAEIRERAREDRLTQPLEALGASFAHMHAIRILRDDVRAHEAAVYASLSRIYESLLARAAPVTDV
jgi:thiopeptide-type bacteriocin biosynthesis protein